MTHLAEFEFQNLNYELTDQAINEVYINIEREFRTVPFIGMKQPTPTGGMLGLEAILKIQHKGEPAPGYLWELYESNHMIQSGVTDIEGHSGELNVDMPHGEYITYGLKVFLPKEPEDIGETQSEGSSLPLPRTPANLDDSEVVRQEKSTENLL